MALESKNGPKPLPHMGQECSGWKGSQSKHNCVTDTKKSAKTGQNWLKIAQTMAIFHHKWLILWGKKIIFINIQLPMGSGQHLIPIGYLEVPLPAACSLVWRALWNRPAPLSNFLPLCRTWDNSPKLSAAFSHSFSAFNLQMRGMIPQWGNLRYARFVMIVVPSHLKWDSAPWAAPST